MVLIQLIWNTDQNRKVIKATAINFSDNAANFHLKRSGKKQYPDYVTQEDAARYGVTVDVQSAKVSEPEITVNQNEETTAPQPAKGGRRKIVSKADVEALAENAAEEPIDNE